MSGGHGGGEVNRPARPMPARAPDGLSTPAADATPITATEAAWVRLKGADAMRAAWQADGVDVCDPNRPAAQPN